LVELQHRNHVAAVHEDRLPEERNPNGEMPNAGSVARSDTTEPALVASR
jgi:hypothetical protein